VTAICLGRILNLPELGRGLRPKKSPKQKPKSEKKEKSKKSKMVIDPTICALLGSSCTEPASRFFETLANVGSFNSPSINKELLKSWIKDQLWASLLMDTVAAGVPQDNLPISMETQSQSETTSKLLLDDFFDFLFSDKQMSPYIFVALIKGMSTSFTSRRLEEKYSRSLEASKNCSSVLTQNVVNALVLCLVAIGIDQDIAQKIVVPLVQAHNDVMEPAFETQFIQQDGLTAGFFASIFIVFLTNIAWSEVEAIVQKEFTGVKLARALMQISIDLMAIFTTGGWIAVEKLTAIMSTLFSLFDNDIGFLNDQCYGATIVTGCEEFQNSGGQGITTSTVNMGQTSGSVTLYYDMYDIPDEIEVFYEGQKIYWSGGLVQRSNTVNLSFGPGKSQLVVVRISAPESGTAWEFSLSCPQQNAPVLPFEITYTSLKKVIQDKKFEFYNGAYNLNLVGIRNRTRTVGSYDDTFCVLYKDDQDNEQILEVTEFTTDPGSYYMVDKLLRAEGCAILTSGQHKSVWKTGKHLDKYKALVQLGGEIDVFRDKNRDLVMDMDPSTIQRGYFGINLHYGGELPEVGMYSAGCQVFQHKDDFNTVMDLVQKQIDHDYGDTFSYTLLDEAELAVAPPLDPFLQRVMVYLDIISYPIQDCAVGYLEAMVDPSVYQTFVCEYLDEPGCTDELDLVTASQQYASVQHQDDALDKLQTQIQSTNAQTWNQFVSYWRMNSACPPETYASVHLRLVDVMMFLDIVKYPFQQCAVEYLESIADSVVMEKFKCDYRNQVSPSCTDFTLVEAAKEYSHLAYQDDALQYFQYQTEFSKRSEWFQFISYWREWGSPCVPTGPKKFIGPSIWYQGSESLPTAQRIAQVERIAWNSDGKTYQDLAIEIGKKHGVHPALLVTHMVYESSIGTASKSATCQAMGKSFLTGCGWYPSCTANCGCSGSYVTSDAGQVACTAQTDHNSYFEAMEGIQYGGGHYVKCHPESTNEDRMWKCILCVYQGNYDVNLLGKDPNAEWYDPNAAFFTKDGTCPYAENFKSTFGTWSKYFETYL
jgi:hypothetical protein